MLQVADSHDNISRNTDHYEMLSVKQNKKKTIPNCPYDYSSSYELKDLKILLLCVKWNIVSNKEVH